MKVLLLSLLAWLASADLYLYDFTLYERECPPHREALLLAHLNNIFEIFDEHADDFYPYLPPGADEQMLFSPQPSSSPSDVPSSTPSASPASAPVNGRLLAAEPAERWDSLSWSDSSPGWYNEGNGKWKSSGGRSGSTPRSQYRHGGKRGVRGVKERGLQISQCPDDCERKVNWNKCRKLGCKCSCGKRRAQEGDNDYFGFTSTQDLDSTLLLEIELEINRRISHYCADIEGCEVMIEISKIPLFQEAV